MNDIEVSSIDLVEGGNVFKQGHYLTLGYIPRDENGNAVDLSGKNITVTLWERDGIAFESAATYSGGVLRFTLNETVPAGNYQIEFTATSSTDTKYRKKFPTNYNSGRISVQQSADDAGNLGISVYTVAQIKSEQQAAQVAYQEVIDPKITTLTKRVDDGVGAFTEDTEIIDARMGKANLRQFNEGLTAQLADIAIQVTSFGADNTGINDSTTAFQNALNHLSTLGGGTLLIPKGDYKVSGSIRLRSNIKIEGVGYPRLFTKTGVGYGHIFGKDYNDITLENVTIRGIFFDQWGELETAIQPDNIGKACNCISIWGRTKNIVVEDNVFHAIGGWVISVTDSDKHFGGTHTYIRRNTIYWKLAGVNWYDASALYAETDFHVIENNYIEAVETVPQTKERWRIEGGIETHGDGVVRWNTIKNAQAGINVVGKSFDVQNRLKTKREISFNTMRKVNRGIWFWSIDSDGGLENIEIFSNDIEVVAEGIYAGYGAIANVLKLLNYNDSTNKYKSGLKKIRIYNNKFVYVNKGYTGIEYFDLTNVGGIQLASNGSVQGIKVYDNEIKNFPYPALVTYQHDFNEVRKNKDIKIYNNEVIDCGYGMPNDFQKSVFYLSHANNIQIVNNEIKWLTKNSTLYLVAVSSQPITSIFEYARNKQSSENGYNITAVNVSSATLELPGVFVDAKNLGYREISGHPRTLNLLPKKIGEVVYNSSGNAYFIAIGTAPSDWQPIPKTRSGSVTLPSGATSITFEHNLGVLPANVLITPRGNIGNSWTSALTTTSITINCSVAPTTSVNIHWTATQ